MKCTIQVPAHINWNIYSLRAHFPFHAQLISWISLTFACVDKVCIAGLLWILPRNCNNFRNELLVWCQQIWFFFCDSFKYSHLQINVVRYSYVFQASAKRIEKPNALSTYIGIARDFISSGWKCVVLFFLHSLASTSFSYFVFIHISTELNFDFIYKRVEHRTIHWFLLHYRFCSVLILFLNHGNFFNI